MRTPVRIRASQVVISGRQALVESTELSEAVTSDKSTIVDELRDRWGSLTSDQISLDSSGRVIIDNDEVRSE